MRSHPVHIDAFVLAALAAFSCQLCAQQPGCVQVRAMAQMARVKSMSALSLLRADAGNSYRAHLVFSFRALELQPSEGTASAVLDLLPQDASHHEEWVSLSGWLCDEEQDRDVNSLAGLQARMPRDFAKSIILFPKRMYQYVSYPVILGLDPHDDYAEQMVPVCRKRHREFAAAVNELPAKDRDWFLQFVFEPSDCRALAHPEAE